MSTRELSFQEVLFSAIDYQISRVYTSIPGVVLAVHNSLSGMRVDVQPLVNMRNEEGTESLERPATLNVPLQLPLSSLGGLSFPVRKGDQVLLVFSMRGLDVWKSGNGQPDMPSDRRQFSPRDCVAIPCIYPMSLSPNDPQKRTHSHSPEDVVLVHNIGSGNEVEIRLKPDGGVVINSPNKVTVNCQNAEVNAEDTISMKAEDVAVECTNYSIATATYSMNATDYAHSFGNISHSGSFLLNGTAVEDHDHGGIQPGGGRTQEFGQ